jgi:hypothetical protein
MAAFAKSWPSPHVSFGTREPSVNSLPPTQLVQKMHSERIDERTL